MNADRIRLSIAGLISISVHGAIVSFGGFAAGGTAVPDRMRSVALTIASNPQIKEQQPEAATVLPKEERRTPTKKPPADETSAAQTEEVVPDLAAKQQAPQTSRANAADPRESSDSEADATPTASQQSANTNEEAIATDHGGSGNPERLLPTEKTDVTAVPLYHLIPKPNYPSRARDLGEEGVVIIAVHVGDDGTVLNAYVSESSGFPLLDGSALATVLERWRFKPGTRRGEAVPSWVRVPIKFSIRGG